MKRKVTLLLSILVIAAFLLGACNLPKAPSEDELAATTVAETAQAVFTRATETAAAASPTVTKLAIATVTPVPTNTLFPTQGPTATQTPIPCNRATFVKDVTMPDNTSVDPGATFTKTWRLKNSGSCSWDSGYVLLFDSGEQMNAPATATITTGSVAPGSTVDISVDLTAPTTPGTYQSNFKLRSPNNIVFGINADGQGPFWVKVVVAEPTATPTATATATDVPAAGDLSIIEIIMKTNFEVAVRVRTTPIGSLSGNFQYTVYADGAQVQQGSCPIPTGSNLCSTGHIISGIESIQVVIDSDNTIAETDESNNDETVSCNKATLTCN